MRDVQVIGVPSQQYGEEVCACIIPRAWEDGLVAKDIQDAVLSNMARHKVPKYVLFMESFPMTASGKIQKFKLRELAVERLRLQDEAAIDTA